MIESTPSPPSNNSPARHGEATTGPQELDLKPNASFKQVKDWNKRSTDQKPDPASPEGAQKLATRIVAALTLHCEREHMTIGERECCREIVRAELTGKS